MKKNVKIVVFIGLFAGFFVVLANKNLFNSDFHYAGTIESTKVDLSARLSSVIETINVKEGDLVKAGDVLLKLACEDIKIAQNLANLNFERSSRLYSRGSEAKAAYDYNKNQIEDIKLKLSWCEIKAPITGRILAKYHEQGEMVGPGTKLFTLSNLEDVHAHIYVAQPYVAKLKIKDNIEGILPELNMQKFHGNIVHISDEAEFTPKNVQTREERERLVYAVKIQFTNEKETLKPGMTLEIVLPDVK